MEVTAQGKTSDGTARSVTVDYDFGENLEEAVGLVGEAVVFANYKASAKITLQALVRRHIAAGDDDDKIVAAVDAWKPGMPSERKVKDPTKNILEAWPKMSEADRADFLRQLKDIK